MNKSNTINTTTNRDGISRCNCSQCKGCAGTARVCFNSRKLSSRGAGNTLAKAAGLLLLLACCFLPGQAKAEENFSVGYLTVFSSTEETQWGDGAPYYVHTGYHIYDSTGTAVKWVANHDSSIDEAPEKVELAPGNYTVWAQSDKDGYVKVPVVIKVARTTAVHLEKGNA